MIAEKRMKILVTVKSVIDPDHKAGFASDGCSLDQLGAPIIVNPFDAIAVEEAVRLREGGVAVDEIVVASIGGDECEKNLRTALAMGADRAIHVASEMALDPWNVSTVLAALIDQEGPDLILMGKQAVDDDSNQAGQFLAARLSLPQATFASKLELIDGNGIRVERETDGGIEAIETSLPAIVTCDLRLNEPRYTALPAIMRAKRKPLDQISIESLNIDLEPRVEVVGLEQANSQRCCVYVDSVDDLIVKLRDEARVLN